MTQNYKPRSLEERGLKEVLGEQYDLFMTHIEVANHTRLRELLGWSEAKFYRRLKLYKLEKERNNAN